LRRADGQFRLLLESAAPQFGPDGSFMGMMGSCNDVSETRFTQHRISMPARANANFTSTLDHAPIAIWKLDRNLVIQKANPAVASQLRMQPDELVGRDFFSIVSSIPKASFEAVLDRGERIQLENYPIVLPQSNGAQKVFWDLTAWPLKDDSGTVMGVCMSSSEVTERQQNLQQREDFVAALVHDLKTPLIGADRTLEQMVNGALGNLDTGQTEVLTMLRRSNHQLLSMVQNLIEVYRYEAGQPSHSFEEFDLFEVLRISVRELQALAQHRGVNLVESLPKSIARINADRLAVRRVFLNLLDNALKFTPQGGFIRISSDENEETYLVHVQDTGIGISDLDQGQLFQRFWQGETGKRYAPGTGLGLYLCKQIIVAHKGSISVSSVENQGTTFSVALPRLK
jgi:PAS domain S-box-containing protein